MTSRETTFERTTRETSVTCRLTLEGAGRAEIETGVPFLDHLLAAFAMTAGFDLEIGAFGAAMERLRERMFVGPLSSRIREGRSTLAICLGLHLLAEASDESPGVPGLGLLPVRVRRIREAPRTPHLGWSPIECDAGCRCVGPGHAYFAHSHAIEDYGAGPNHVLPTGRAARSWSGLSVFTFLRTPTWFRVDDPAAAEALARDAEALARLEGLDAHAASAALRRDLLDRIPTESLDRGP